jgi:toxin FitB
MIILDTNFISEAAKLDMDAGVRRWLGVQSMSNLHATAVSVAEVSFGVERMPEGRRKDIVRDDMRMIFDRYFPNRILPFDEKAGLAYGLIVAKARAEGFSISMPDGQIAAIARVHGSTVATRDTSPFQAAGILVINPWEN